MGCIGCSHSWGRWGLLVVVFCLSLADARLPAGGSYFLPRSGRHLQQVKTQNASDCSLTNVLAFHSSYSTTAYQATNMTSCYTVPFKLELTDNYVNRLTNETRNFTYTYNGTIVGGMGLMDCPSVQLQTGSSLIDSFFNFWRPSAGLGQLITFNSSAAPFDRPYLPFPKNEICINRDLDCILDVTQCNDTRYDCPVRCGTCNTTWILKDFTYKVLEATFGTCCGPDADCRLAQNYVTEVQWTVPPEASLFPPKPIPAPIPAPFNTVKCQVTPWEAFLAPKSGLVYLDSGFNSCLGFNATVVMEETFTDLRANRTLKTRFTRQGSLILGDANYKCGTPGLDITKVLTNYLDAPIRSNGSTYGIKAFLMTSYGSRVDGLYPPASVCYDKDYRCFSPGTNPCRPGSDLVLNNLCPATCNGCGSSLVMRLDDIKVVDIGAQLTTCCDTTNDNLCTTGKSLMQSNGLPTTILDLTPPAAPSQSFPPPPPQVLPSPSPSPIPRVVSTEGSSTNKTVIIGAAVGGAVGLLALIALLAFCLCRRKQATHVAGKGAVLVTPKDFMGVRTDRDLPPPTPGIEPLSIKGLSTAEPFVRGTAYEYSWAPTSVSAVGKECIEADVNDTKFDRMVPTDGLAATGSGLPPVYLSKEELKKQVFLLQDGLLGKGATAVVFKATWPSRFGPDAVLAVKMLKDGADADIATLESFSYEATVLSSTRHPNVVRMYGYCMEPPNVCLILEVLQHSVKDLLYKAKVPASGTQPWGSKTNGTLTSDGEWTSSSQQVHQTVVDSASGTAMSPAVVAQVHLVSPHGHSTGTSDKLHHSGALSVRHAFAAPGPELPPLSMAQVLQISADVASGLAYLHDTPLNDDIVASFRMSRPVPLSPMPTELASPVTPGDPNRHAKIVHRDMKPANILINSIGRAKISDFGLARQHNQTTIQTERAGAGTLPYMAPELLMSAYSRFRQSITNKVDIYSFAMIMYELLAREMPWKGNSEMAIVTAVTSGNRPPLPTDDAKEHDVVHNSSRPNGGSLADTPASLTALPELLPIIRACWHQRDVKRPNASAVHTQLMALLNQRPDVHTPPQ